LAAFKADGSTAIQRRSGAPGCGRTQRHGTVKVRWTPNKPRPGADQEAFKSFKQAERFLTVRVANISHIRHPASTTAADRGTGRERAFAIWHGMPETGAAA
jgi:hypothetical protein